MIAVLVAGALAAAAPESFPEPIRPFLAAKTRDGKKVLSGDSRGLRVWDLASGKQEKFLDERLATKAKRYPSAMTARRELDQATRSS